MQLFMMLHHARCWASSLDGYVNNLFSDTNSFFGYLRVFGSGIKSFECLLKGLSFNDFILILLLFGIQSLILTTLQGSGKSKKEKTGISLVDLAYRRAKSVKAVKKAVDAGKIVKKTIKKSKRPPQTTKSRTEENEELFQSDMSEKKQKRNIHGTGKKKSHSFKSKSRYVNYNHPKKKMLPITVLFCLFQVHFDHQLQHIQQF